MIQHSVRLFIDAWTTVQDRFNSNVRLLPPEVAKVLLGAAVGGFPVLFGSKLKLFFDYRKKQEVTVETEGFSF